MSNDRELLELAAKAAGIDGVWHEEWKCLTYMGAPAVVGPEPGLIRRIWSPLTDDGDALRLAVALGAILGCFHGMGYSSVSIAFPDNDGEAYAQEYFHDHEGDRHSATRRAIVRAAAGVGGRTAA